VLKKSGIRTCVAQVRVLSLIADMKPMSQLIVRQIEAKVVRKLKERAGRNGVSMEEEHRRILRDALLGENRRQASFKQCLLAMPDVGTDRDFVRQEDIPREVKL